MFSKSIAVVSFVLLFAVSTPSAGNPPAERPTLPLNEYVRRALANNAGLAALRAGYRQNMTQARRVKAIRDLMLAASTGFTSSDMMLNNGIPQGVNNYAGFTSQVSLSGKFPHLLGMSAGLSLSYSRSGYDHTSYGSMDSAAPAVNLQVSLPLLRNFLGKIDRNTLKNSDLTVRALKHAENEAIENFIQSLISAYIDWGLLVAKTEIYRGITARAGGLYAQTLRKRNVGMADWSDVYLVQANYLRYQGLLASTRLQAEQQYLTVVTLMTGKRSDAMIPIKPAHSPARVTNRIRIGDQIRIDTLRAVRMGEIQYRQAVLERFSAKNGSRPDLNLILNAGRSGTGSDAGEAFSDFTKNQFYAGLELSVSLQNTDRKLALQAAAMGMEKAARELLDTRRNAGSTLRNLRHSIGRMQDILKVTRRMETSNRLRLTAMFGKYTQGRVALSQVTDARDAYANSRISYLEQQTALEKLYYSYLALTDRLLPRYTNMLQNGKK